MRTSYAIGIGSNMRHGRYGAPWNVTVWAMVALRTAVASFTRTNRPLGPSRRSFSNAVVLVSSDLSPPEMLDHLKGIETEFGRRRGGRRWGARVLDLDIILWSGGMWADDRLVIPHPAFRERSFVLDPLARIAPCWRDPVSGLTVRQLKARLDRRRPLP